MVIKYFVASVGFLLCVVLFTLHISYNPVPCFTKSTYAQCLTVIKLRLPLVLTTPHSSVSLFLLIFCFCNQLIKKIWNMITIQETLALAASLTVTV